MAANFRRLYRKTSSDGFQGESRRKHAGTGAGPGSRWTRVADPDIVRPMRIPAGGGWSPRIPPGFVLGVIVLGIGTGLAIAAPGPEAESRPDSGANSGRNFQPPEERPAGEAGARATEKSGAQRNPGGKESGTVVLTGVRASRGGAVECPLLRDDAGVLHPVSYLPPRIALGDRVTIKGTFGVTTTCRGLVLVVDELVEGAGVAAPGGG